MLGCVLAPLDGSALAERALPHAVAIARASDCKVLLLRVLTAQPPRGTPLVQEAEARTYLDALASQLGSLGISIEIELSTTLFGRPAEVIVETAHRRNAQIIVMSTHGRSGLGRWLYGSVAERILRSAPIPVLLVPAASDRPLPTARRPRVLLALDGSEPAVRAIEPTRALARALGADVLLVRVQPRSTADAAAYMCEDPLAEHAEAVRSLESAAAPLRDAGIDVTLHTPVGDAAVRIADVAREQDVDVIAMATHSRSGMRRLVLGSVATEVLHRARLPMLLVGSPSRQATSEAISAIETAARGAESMTLLVPLDLTEKADAVLPEVARIARAADADVVLLNVFQPIVKLGRVMTDSSEEGIAYVSAERRMYLERKAEQLRGINVTTRVEALPHGEEVDESIARIAAETHAAMVVLASRRATSAVGLVLGSIAQGVLARSPCPVTIVRYTPTPRPATGASAGQQ